jgi:hypothetical protein
VAVEKFRDRNVSLAEIIAAFEFFLWPQLSGSFTLSVVGWLRNRTSRLMFWAAAARKNCSRTNLSLRRRKRRRPIWFFSCANKASLFFFAAVLLRTLVCSPTSYTPTQL